jgi:aminoglycoside phosphotransferase (APT) family kinase protein
VAEFDAALAKVLAGAIDGFESLDTVERLSGGASQETYRLTIRAGGEERLLCMRRAPGGVTIEARELGYPGLAAEARLMQVAREAGIPEPVVYHVLEPDDGVGAGFIMEWLEGEALGARIVRGEGLAEIRPKLAFEYGQILARIHAIDLAASGLDELLSPLPPAKYIEQTWQRYQALPTPQPMIDYAGRWLTDNCPADFTPTLVHNDFRNGNVMVDREGVVAVLDWEIAHIGDPMRDLGWICTNSWRFGSDLPVGGFGEYEDLFAGYEAVSGQPVDPERVRYWQVFGSFWWAVGSLGMAEHYRTGPDKTVERPAIGRRTSECQIDCVNLLFPGPIELVEAAEPDGHGDMPRIDELVQSVREYLRDDVMPNTRGRTSFLARVAGNSLDIVQRDLALGPEHRRRERERLEKLLGTSGGLEDLRWQLARGLRDGGIGLDLPGLQEHLRQTVANQIAIDQPRYSGLRQALVQA